MALMLDVPWKRGYLPVGYDSVTDVISGYGAPYVGTDGDDVIVENFFGMNNRVPDVSRYHIDDDGQPVRHFDIPESRLQIQRQSGSIVLLLESPYNDEYQFGNINFPIAPANGRTGENIDRCLNTVLSRIRADLIEAGLTDAELSEAGRIVPGCHVIISNPIQFQTSLHAIHGEPTQNDDHRWATLRNNVWKALWKEGEGECRLGYIQLCFRARLNTYRPSVIVNACTGDWCGRRGYDPKRLVNIFLARELPNVPRYKTYHPSSWDNCNDIDLQRVPPQANPNAGNPQ